MLNFDGERSDAKNKTRQFGALGVVVAIHALLLYLVLSGLGRHIITVVPETIQVALLPSSSPQKEEKQQAAAPPQVKRALKSVAPPLPQVVIAVPPVPTAPPAPPPSAPEVAPIAAGPATGTDGTGNASGSGNAGLGNGEGLRTISSGVEYARKPVLEYPRSSRRSGEEGVTIMRVLVSETGMPIKATIQKSSGYERLDDAAHDAVMSALFKPFTENGKAFAANVLVPIKFKLND